MSWAISLAAALASPFAQTPELTLDEAIQIAVRNAFSSRLARSEVEQARQRVYEARGALGPRLSIDGTYTRFDRAQTTQFGSQTIVVRPIDQKQAQLGVALPIDISGNIRRGINAARFNYQATQELFEAEINEIKHDVRLAFFQLLQAESLVEVTEEAVRNAEERVKLAEAQHAAGDIARVDVLRFQTLLSQARTDLVEAENRVRLAKNLLNNVLGRPIETPVEPVEPETMPRAQAPAPNYVRAALVERPDVQALQLQRRALAEIRRAEERGLNPALVLSGVHQRNLDAQGFGASGANTTAVASLSFPIWDSGITRARVRQARQDEEQARIRLEQLELGVSLEVRQALSNLQDAEARLQTARQTVTLAEETYRLQKLRMDAGEGIPIEVTEAQTELTRARSRLVAARYNYLAAYAALQRAVAADDPEAPGEELK